MEKIIQFTTKTETDAFKTVDLLQSLDAKDDINLSEYVVIEKTAEGTVNVKEDRTDVFVGTATGGLTGSFLGALFGPYGLILGGAFGSMIGLSIDGLNTMDKEEILEKITADIPNDSVVIVAHIFEQWEAPIDTSIGELAEISRIDIDEEVSKAIEADLEELDREIDEVEKNLKDSVGEAKEKTQAKLDELKEKRNQRQKLLNEKVKAQKAAYKSWLTKTKEKLKSFKDKNLV